MSVSESFQRFDLGDPALVGIDRGVSEFRAGRPVLIGDATATVLAWPIEGLNADRLGAIRALSGGVAPSLALTARRAAAIGLPTGAGAVTLPLKPDDNIDRVWALAFEVPYAADGGGIMPAGSVASAALDLAKLAQRLPAAVIVDAGPLAATSFNPPVMTVASDRVSHFRTMAAASLEKVSEARVPLRAGLGTRFVVFRDGTGSESVAVVVGNPDLSVPVPVRLHSACLTGDVFGSRRCDCGDQLKLALGHLSDLGGGVVLYLEQEGRGLGLANKMRAYTLQDAGFDTVDANTALGFDPDQRDYSAAARMLSLLGCERVRLLTNNPSKVDGLPGIDVVSRMPLFAPVNRENLRYLTAKAERAGHRLEHLIETVASRD